jgi:hypothetical protein
MRISAAINGYSYIYRMSDERTWQEADQLDDALRRQLVTTVDAPLLPLPTQSGPSARLQ